MKVVFAILLVVEVVLVLDAVHVTRWMDANMAAVLCAVNVIFLILAAKKMRKKRACCS